MNELFKHWDCDRIIWLPKERILHFYKNNKLEFSIRNLNLKENSDTIDRKLLGLLQLLNSYMGDVI